MGLIQRIIESNGIPSISISVNRPYTEKVKPPRSIFLRWPFGHPLGEPGRADQQAAVLNKAFEALCTIETPGQIIDVDWPWRRKTYAKQLRCSNKSTCQAIRRTIGDTRLSSEPVTN